ncbi:Ataxin 3 [Perkinsus chesapeaki]|uniref:ubiquitinyl hydrolase 1 n=1 Tax=Perkinsus chesapeaki TaxID=330153 RepID=A0A7J6N2C9_PERCH|nr:Ataxin 3 [Perkinsus chesapeaki]
MQSSNYVYWEKQGADNLCAVHCVNSLLQGPYYNEADLNSFARDLDREEEALLGTKIPDGQSQNYDASGNYSIGVIEKCLKRFGELKCVNIMGAKTRTEVFSAPQLESGYVCNQSNHWFSLRRVGSGSPASQTWWNLDSLRLQAPKKLSTPTELSSLIQSIVGQGYTVFVIRGDVPLPQPSKTANSGGMMTLSSNNGMKGMYLTEREAAQMEAAARSKTTGNSFGGGASGEGEGPSAFTMIAPSGARNNEPPQKTDWDALGSGRSLGTSTDSSGPSPQPEIEDPDLAAALAASLSDVSLPAPPDEPASGPRVTTVQVRLPTGKRWTRRFNLDTNTLGDLFLWMEWQSLQDSKTSGGTMPLLTSLGGYDVLKQGFGPSRRKFHRIPRSQKVTISGEPAEIEYKSLGEATSCLNVIYMFNRLFGSSSSKKKKRQETSPSPTPPVPLKKPKLAAKSAELTLGDKPSSAFLEKKKSKQACATCGSTEFREAADWGYLICAVCGEASSQRIEEQEFEEAEQRGGIRAMNISSTPAGVGGNGGGGTSGGLDRAGKLTKKDPSGKRLTRGPAGGGGRVRTGEHRSLEELLYCFQLCLKRVATEVCDALQLGEAARKRVLENTRDAWREYLELAATDRDRTTGQPKAFLSKVFYDRHINSRTYGSRFFDPVVGTASKRMDMALAKFEEKQPTDEGKRPVMGSNARGLIRALEQRNLQAPAGRITTRRGRRIKMDEGEMADLLYEHDWLARKFNMPTDAPLPSAFLQRSGQLKDTDYEGRRHAVRMKFKKERAKAEKAWALEEEQRMAIEEELGHSVESSSPPPETTSSTIDEGSPTPPKSEEECSEQEFPLAIFRPTLSEVSSVAASDLAEITPSLEPPSEPPLELQEASSSTPSPAGFSEEELNDPLALDEPASGRSLPPLDFPLLLSLVLLALRRANYGVVSGRMVEWILTGAVDYNRLHVLLPAELDPMTFRSEIEGSSSVLRPRYLPCSYQLDQILMRLRDRFNLVVPPLPADCLVIEALKAIGFPECTVLALRLLDWLVAPLCPLYEVEHFPSYPFGNLYSMSSKAEDVLPPEETEPLDPPIHGICPLPLTCAALVVISVKLSVPGLYEEADGLLPETHQMSLDCVRWWTRFTREERFDFLMYCEEELFSDYRPCLAPELQARLRPDRPYHPLQCKRGRRPDLQVSESPPAQYRTYYRSRGACRIEFDNGQMPSVYAWLLDSVCSVLHTDGDDLDREISSLEDWLFKREAPARQDASK